MNLTLFIEIQMRDEASFVRVLKKKQNLRTTLNIEIYCSNPLYTKSITFAASFQEYVLKVL